MAPNGKASNSGTSADSPLTVSEAVDKVSAGGTIVFRGGTYRDIGGNDGEKITEANVTLQAYPNEKPLLVGTTLMTGAVREGAVWSINAKYKLTNQFPLNLGCPKDQPTCYLDKKYPFANLRDMVFVKDKALTQVGSRSAVLPGTFFADRKAGKLIVGTDPGGGAEVATEERAFVVGPKGSGFRVRGLGISRYANMSLDIRASKVTLENNKFNWNAIYGAMISGGNATVRGNTFAYNGMMGLRGVQNSDSLVENNLIHFNNYENFARIWSASGYKVLLAHRLVVRGNTFSANRGAGGWCDISCKGTKYENNRVIDNDGIGIFCEVSDTCEIKNNYVEGNGAGIMLNNTTRTKVHHNTLVNNKIGIYVGETPRKNTNAAEIAQGNTWQAVGNSVYDNVMSGENNLLKVCSYKPGAIVDTVDRNVYHLTGKGGSVASFHKTGRGCGTKYPTVAALKAATGKERSGVQVTSLGGADLKGKGATLTR